MPHADSSLVPSSITTKADFWIHVHDQLQALIEGEKNWVSNLANTSSLIYHSLLAFPAHFGSDETKAVNWCGFYLHSRVFPTPNIIGATHEKNSPSEDERLLLGPFCGKPACQYINVGPGKARGVCADAFLQGQTILVPDVDAYPGHIACDGETRSEIVCPLLITLGGKETVIGVIDLDCLAQGGFDDADKAGLERIAAFVSKGCDW